DIHESILNLKNGYDTEVGEQGIDLSGGQKQRVAIARALLQKTPIIIFDDSLSAVDTETEIRIQRALQNQKGKATTFIIAHRLTSLMQADLILVLDKGKIQQSGTHQELLSKRGIYQKVWNMQNSLDNNLQQDLDQCKSTA
ncbi:MAG: ATP-binding cassette domain-containing protein, partial [Candidatus Komeilibacteria bacterium]